MNKWTDEQMYAITARDSNMLVAAGAGAGKTAVLVERIIRRITDPVDPVDVDKLLVVTFTNAAAAEMRDRIARAIAAKLNKEPGNSHLERQLALLNLASITTLHSFCLDVLRRHYYQLNLDPAFRVADDTEAALLQVQVLEDLFEDRYAAGDAGFAALVDSYGGERDDLDLANLVLKLYEFSRSQPWPEEWLNRSAQAFQLPQNITLNDTPWCGSLKKSIAIKLEEARNFLTRALDHAGRPGGPKAYKENLLEDIRTVETLAMACNKSWEALQQVFADVAWGKLKPCKKDVDEQLKKRVARLRDTAKKAINAFKDRFFSRSSEELLADLRRVAPLMEALARLVADYSKAYQKAKQAKGLVDFSDLEHFCLKIFLAPEAEAGQVVPSEIALEFRKRYAEVLVDEYQDINQVQETLLQLVSRQGETKPNMFMVGDVKQSIYRFRLTEPELFLEKYRRYPVDQGARERRIDLTRNFRSRREVVEAVNFIFRQIMTPRVGELAYDEGAELVFSAGYPEASTEKDPPVAGPVELHLIEREPEAEALEQEHEVGKTSGNTAAIELEGMEELDAVQAEARIIARRIKELAGTPFMVFEKTGRYRPVRYRDIVILLRATKGVAGTFLEEFRLAGIPAYAELGTGYFEATEVETVLSLLKVIDNPQQDIPLAAVLRSPVVGLNAGELAQIRLADSRGNFYGAVKAAARADAGKLSEKLKRFLDQLENWRTMARQGSLSDLIWQLYRETGYYDYVGGLPGGAQRQANLRALHDRARQYEATMFRGLFRFLRFIERLQESGSDLGAARALGENEDVVRIMSIHKSKGLEFPVVFAAGLGKQFNFRDVYGETLLHKDLGLGPELVDLDARVKYPTLAKLAIREKLKLETLAEELRILYVALTRAREKLILVGSVRGLRNRAEGWCEHLSQEDWALPDAVLAAARTYLDWLCPALVRHPDAAGLRRMGGTDKKPAGKPAGDPSRWEVHIWNNRQAQLLETGQKTVDSDFLEKLRCLEPVEVPDELLATVKERLEWTYPCRMVVEKPAKVAVTEVKRRFDTLREEEEREARPHLPPVTGRPGFLQKQGLSAAERGSALHLIMQHLDLQGDLSPAGIREQINSMILRELLTEEQAKAVDERKLAQFFITGLGQRLLRAIRVKREIPFSLALPAREIYPGLPAGIEEKVLVQGVIDCLIEEKDGFVIVDWKTDRLGADKLQEAIERYRGQINLYARAVTTILKRPVKEKYLYLLEPGLEIPI